MRRDCPKSEGGLTVEATQPSFESWWRPFTLGVGPADAYVTGLDPKRRDELRETCRSLLPEPPITLSATAWAALGRA